MICTPRSSSAPNLNKYPTNRIKWRTWLKSEAEKQSHYQIGYENRKIEERTLSCRKSFNNSECVEMRWRERKRKWRWERWSLNPSTEEWSQRLPCLFIDKRNKQKWVTPHSSSPFGPFLVSRESASDLSFSTPLQLYLLKGPFCPRSILLFPKIPNISLFYKWQGKSGLFSKSIFLGENLPLSPKLVCLYFWKQKPLQAANSYKIFQSIKYYQLQAIPHVWEN